MDGFRSTINYMEKEHNTYVMAADVGGTNTRVAMVSSEGEIHTLIKRGTHCKDGKDEMLSFLISLFTETINNSKLPREKISGMGIGFPGPLDAQTGVIFNPPNLPGWNNVPLRNILEDEFRLPVAIENDANAAALGEWWKGVGVGTKSFVCITLGTGVGGGIILGGKLWYGASSMAGEIGHTTVIRNGIHCTCGNRGCLEAYASARGIIERTRRILSETEKGGEAESSLTFKDISNMASQGDDRILPIIHETGVILGIAVANLANLLNPEMIALFGGVTSLGERLLNPMKEEVKKRAFQKAREPLRIEVAKLGGNGGLLGAAKRILVHIDA